jgi:hypothetical protein
MKYQEKLQAIKLRKEGKSYGIIRKIVKVSKASLSIWLKDVEIRPDIQKEMLIGREKSRYFAALAKRNDCIKRTKKIVDSAEKEFKHLVKSDLFLSGLLLYWAEGDKKQERVKFANSDKDMIWLMMRWFREVCHVPESKFRIALHIHNLHMKHKVKEYWSKVTGVNQNQFNKVYIKKTTLKHKRIPLYEGTCSIVVCSKELFRKIVGWRRGLLAHFKI